MIRYFYSLCLVLVCVALPMHANAKTLLPSSSSDTSDKSEQGHKASNTNTVSKDKTTSTSTTSSKESRTSDAKTSKASTTTASVKESKASETKTEKVSTTTTATKKHDTASATTKTVSDSSSKGSTSSSRRLGSMMARINGRLARLTAYWAGEGDYYTGRCISATGVRLHGGHCAVDPSVIPYGSQVEISGLGTYLAVDTGTAVITRKAARETGHTSEERNALVIDLFFESRHEGERFAANGPKFATISWRSPREADNETKETAGLIAEESWNKNHNHEL